MSLQLIAQLLVLVTIGEKEIGHPSLMQRP